jgi:aarF domain-containing kinase
VKVRRDGMKELMMTDLSILRWVASVLSFAPSMEWLSIPDAMMEFAGLMETQLDLQREASNLQRFAKLFKRTRGISFPRPHMDLVSEDVLVESWADGVDLGTFLESGRKGEQQQQLCQVLADTGVRAFLKMMLVDNFVHADLHPGNILVVGPGVEGQAQATSSVPSSLPLRYLPPLSWVVQSCRWVSHKVCPPRPRASLVFLDAGLVTTLSTTDRRNFVDLFRAVACKDGGLAARLMLDRARNKACNNPESFQCAMQCLLGAWSGVCARPPDHHSYAYNRPCVTWWTAHQ